MLQGNFFTITHIKQDEKSVKASLKLNHAHKIFDGHFPQIPVVPGVCMMQMVKEVVEDVIDNDTKVLSVAHMKFLTVINPQETKTVQLDLKFNPRENKEIEIVASLFNEDVVYFKFKGLLKSL
jgi:3-hydroxyacyl-[acyl-carrier-protein] dehydratase